MNVNEAYHMIASSDINEVERCHNEIIIDNASLDDIDVTVASLEEQFIPGDTVPTTFPDICKMFGITDMDTTPKEKLYDNVKQIISGDNRLIEMLNKIKTQKGGFNYNPTDNALTLGHRLKRLITVINCYEQVCTLYKHMSTTISDPFTVQEFDPRAIMLPSGCDDEEMVAESNDLQVLILHALQYFRRENYKRYKGFVCRQVRNTKAWEKVDTIEDHIEKLYSKEKNPLMWKRFTKNGQMRKHLVEHLVKCVDSQFPELKKNRNVFSFRNGLYICKEQKFYPYESKEFRRLDPTIVSANYFDQDFDDNLYESYRDIPTPSLDSITNYQNFDQDTKDWLWAFMGRMLYDVNEMDMWQVVPFFKGMASTGKGKLCEIAANFYEGEDVGQLSDLPEKAFGLSAVYDKLVFIAPEITDKFGLGQADFQSMVSGERVSIAIKFKTAQSIEWSTPGMFAGNEPPGYKDNSGSIQRRVVIFPFLRQVMPEDMDMELPFKLKEEMGNIMRKCNEAYLVKASENKRAGIWSKLPQALLNAREEMALATNSLRHFMAAPEVEYGPDKKIPLKKFISKFNEHCRDNNLNKQKFMPDFYNGPFSSKRVEVRKMAGIWQDVEYTSQAWVVGLDVTDGDYMGLSNDM